MSLIGGPVAVLLVAVMLFLGIAAWLRRDRRYPGPRLHGEDGIDRDALEEAEREVRDQQAPPPTPDRPGDDWGPGTTRPRPPVRL
jgi:hypothetical protein